jgi:hypothetical protein
MHVLFTTRSRFLQETNSDAKMPFSSCLSWCILLSAFSVDWKAESFAYHVGQLPDWNTAARCPRRRPFLGGVQRHAIGNEIERQRKGIPRISTVKSMDDFFKVLAEDERLTVIK